MADIRSPVVHVVPYYPPRLGGMEVAAKELAEGLAGTGLEVDVITCTDGGAPPPSSESPRVHYLRAWEVAHTPVAPTLLLHLLRLPRNAVVHVHVAHAYIPEMVALASLIRKIPYVAHLHLDVDKSGRAGFLLPLYKKLFLRCVLHRASIVLVPTVDYSKKVHDLHEVDPGKIRILPNGPSVTPVMTRHALGDPVQLLFVGRLSKQKNLPLLVDAIALATRSGMRVKLTVVGEGDQREDLVARIEQSNLRDVVELKGKVTGDALAREYARADVFLLTSSRESFGIVLVEAMQAGLVVVAPNIDGVRNVVRHMHNGLLVEPEPEEYVAALQLLAGNRELRETLSHHALKDAEAYSWPRIVERVLDVYAEVSAAAPA